MRQMKFYICVVRRWISAIRQLNNILLWLTTEPHRVRIRRDAISGSYEYLQLIIQMFQYAHVLSHTVIISVEVLSYM